MCLRRIAEETRMQGKGFITLWLVATASMALASFGWHGWLLNDIARLELPLATFVPAFGLAYLLIGFVLTSLCVRIELDIPNALKGLLIGGVLGFFLYLVAFLMGLSFQEAATSEHVLFDFAWQMIEQGVGGFVVGLMAPMVLAPSASKEPAFALESIIKKKTTAA